MNIDCCINFCRDWRETIGNKGLKLPPSLHSPVCENYELEVFLRISHAGNSCICEERELDYFLHETEEKYEIEKIQMTRDQFDNLEEFTGF